MEQISSRRCSIPVVCASIDRTQRRTRRTAIQLAIAGLFAGDSVSRSFADSVTLLNGATTYSQNFDGMSSVAGATSPVPAGWNADTLYGSHNGSVILNGSAGGTTATVSTGSGTSRGNYDFGSTSSTDRALGTIASGSFEMLEQVGFTNGSALNINSFSVIYSGEQWRNGGSGNVNTLTMLVSTDGVNFTALGSSFNFNSPINTTTAGALDGNSSANRTTNIGGSYSFATPVGASSFFLRWVDPDDVGNDDGLAIDDVSVSFQYGSAIVFSSGTWSPTGGSTAWDHSTANFITGVIQHTFADGSAVTFSDSGVGSVTIDPAGVSPSTTTVTNASATYTMTGGPILTGSLLKTGAGTLILANSSNGYSGGTTINGGTLQLGADNVLPPKGAVTIGPGATLDENGHAEYLGTLTLGGGTVTSGAGTGSILASSIIVNGTVPSTIAGRYYPYSFLTVNANTGTVDLDIEANIVGPNEAVFYGAGTVLLNGDNSAMTGGAYAAGNVIAGNAKALGPAQQYNFSGYPFVLNGGTLSASKPLTGSDAIIGNVQLTNNVTFNGPNPIEFAGFVSQVSALTLTVNNQTTIDQQFFLEENTNGYVEAVTINGVGTLTLQSAANITGTFKLSGNTIVVGTKGSIYASSGLILDTSNATPSLVLMNATSIDDSTNVVVTGGSQRQAVIALASGTETIHSLTLNGLSLPAGIYSPGDKTLSADGLTLSGALDGYLDVSTVLPEPFCAGALTLTPLILSRRRRSCRTLSSFQ